MPPPIPSAGVVEREIEQEYEAKPLEMQKDIPSVEVDIPEERLDFPSHKTVSIQAVTIEGNESVSDREIQGWIEEFVGTRMSIADIYRMCKTIDEGYAANGYFLARAYPPPQDIQDGVLVIRILEGRIGSIEVEGNKHYKTAFIRKYFEPFCCHALKYDEFLKALLLLNENADLSAGVLFEKGRQVGTADLIVRVKDKRPIHLYLNENNYGRNLTTNTQMGGALIGEIASFKGINFPLQK